MKKRFEKIFLLNGKKLAQWKNPKSKIQLTKIVSYFLKNGSVVKVQRENFNLNIFWKYVQPLKYYFLRMRVKSNQMREVQLRSISNKWQIERK